jgi:hypothetical protein
VPESQKREPLRRRIRRFATIEFAQVARGSRRSGSTTMVRHKEGRASAFVVVVEGGRTRGGALFGPSCFFRKFC